MLDPVTTRYVEALFNLATREGVLDRVERDVEKLAGELTAPGVGEFYFDARLSQDARRLKIDSLLTSAHQLTKNFVHLLFDKRREDVLRNLGAAFHARALAERNTAEGVVESARPLGAGEIAQLAETLGRKLGKSVTLKNEIDPGLVGGVRVIVESKMLDRSVRGRLDGLRKKMEEAPLPSAQS